MKKELLEGQVRKLVGDVAYQCLMDNGRIMAELKGTDDEPDFTPIVKLFLPGHPATWLLTELDPEEPWVAFGLADLGVGFPEIGSVWLPELLAVCREVTVCDESTKEPILTVEVKVEKDLYFEALGSLQHYARLAREAGSLAAVC